MESIIPCPSNNGRKYLALYCRHYPSCKQCYQSRTHHGKGVVITIVFSRTLSGSVFTNIGEWIIVVTNMIAILNF
jgi:hypothetical protein